METATVYDKDKLLETLNTKLKELIPNKSEFTPIVNMSNKQERKKIFKLIQTNNNINNPLYMEYFKYLFIGVKSQSLKHFNIIYTPSSNNDNVLSQIDNIMLLIMLNYTLDKLIHLTITEESKIDEDMLKYYSDNYMEYMKTKCEDKSFFEGLLMKRKINHLLNGPCEGYENVSNSKNSILLLNHSNFKKVFNTYFYQKYLKNLSKATYYYLKLDEIDFDNELDSYIKRFDHCMLLEDFIVQNGKSLQMLGKFKRQYGIEMFFQHYEDKMAMIKNEMNNKQQSQHKKVNNNKDEDIDVEDI